MKSDLLNKLRKTPQIIAIKSNKEDKHRQKELFTKFKKDIIPTLEAVAEKDITSYQVPVDNWEISDNIHKWCNDNGLKYWSSIRKIDHRPPVFIPKLTVDEIKVMTISWE
jgi:hypothetical protein